MMDGVTLDVDIDTHWPTFSWVCRDFAIVFVYATSSVGTYRTSRHIIFGLRIGRWARMWPSQERLAEEERRAYEALQR